MTVLGLEHFKPSVDRPSEFLRFWALTVAELQGVAPSPALGPRIEIEPGLDFSELSYTSLDGITIQAYLLRPAGERECPLIVHAHAYNDRYEVMVDWARRGCNVLGFDARGFGRSAASVTTAENGYVLTGIESPQTSILRGAVADYLQAVNAAKLLLAKRYTSISFYGFSFGGALALMAAGLSRDADFVVLGQPAFGWHEERRRLALAGSTREINAYVGKYPWRLDSVISTLEYFDTLYFAPLIKAPALVGVGLDDDVVPSRTVLAVANHMQCPLELRLLPVSHSADPRVSPWRGFHSEWLSYVVDGLPADFGLENRQVNLVA